MTMEKTSEPEVARGSVRPGNLFGFFKKTWVWFWMHFAGTGPLGRLAAWLVIWFAPPHFDRWALRFKNPRGFVAPSATLHGKDIHLGPNIFVDDRVLLFQGRQGGPIEIGAQVTISRNTIIDTSLGGSVSVGKNTVLQPHCLLSAAMASIRIGEDVGIGPYCAFYPHDHGTAQGQPISTQPLAIKGDIVIEDGVWLGHGVTVLSGARIGKGAVIGAGSTVASDVPEGAIAWGVPAKVFMKRKNAAKAAPLENTTGSVKTHTGEGTP